MSRIMRSAVNTTLQQDAAVREVKLSAVNEPGPEIDRRLRVPVWLSEFAANAVLQQTLLRRRCCGRFVAGGGDKLQ